jgi:hypothetical protein
VDVNNPIIDPEPLNSTNGHPLILSRLYPHKRVLTTPLLVTPSRPKRTHRAHRALSLPLTRSTSPYYIGALLLYIFNKEFYNNSEILNSDLMPSGVTYGVANN